MLYYLCFFPPQTGGELVNVQHVTSLHRMGVKVVALLNPDAKIDPALSHLPFEILLPNKQFYAEDVVVIPEYYRDAFQYFAKQSCRCVIHTQGPFLTFRGFSSIAEFKQISFMGGISCSQFTREMMLSMGAILDWQVVRPFVLPIFKPNRAAKKLQIAYMPDKRPKESAVIQAMFTHHYPQWAHIPWIPIQQVSRQRCAEILAESAIFASFSYLEGLGLPPLEAMASECVVCGFTGGGGTEYATAENGIWINEGDWLGFVHGLAQLLSALPANPQHPLIAGGKKTAEAYSVSQFEQSLLAAWQHILGEEWAKFARI